MNRIKFIVVLTASVFFVKPGFSQPSIPIKGGAALGALEFLPNGKLADGHSRVASQFPGGTDPMLDPQKWYNDGQSREEIRGFVGDAVLFFEWWTKQSSPAERYKFDWNSSGYFEILIPQESGIPKIVRIDRYRLEKYPNLLRRFDNLYPLDVDFEINFRASNFDDQDYADFRKKYNIMESLGSAGYSISYTRKLDGDFILYKLSGNKSTWTIPGSVLGGWDYFLNFDPKYNDKHDRLIELFKLGRHITINSFKISNIKWRISDFAYIAKKFEAYEEGKEKPDPMDLIDQCKTPEKAGGDFWDDTDLLDTETESFYDEVSRKYGIRTTKKKVLVEGKYDNIVKSADGMNYLAKIGNTAYLLNKRGAVLRTRTFSKLDYLNADMSVTVNSDREKIEGALYTIYFGESESMLSDNPKKKKWYRVQEDMYLTVTDSDDHRSEEQKKRDEEAWKQRRKELVKAASDRYKSMGYE